MGGTTGNLVVGIGCGFFLNQLTGFSFANNPDSFSGGLASRIGLAVATLLRESTTGCLAVFEVETSCAGLTGGSSGNRATSTGVSFFNTGSALGEAITGAGFGVATGFGKLGSAFATTVGAGLFAGGLATITGAGLEAGACGFNSLSN